MKTPDDHNNPWDRFWAWLMAYPIKLVLPHNQTTWGRNAANAITVLRGIATTGLFIGLVQAEPTQRNGWLVAMFFVQLTDGADGALARGTDTTSRRGSILDGSVDKYSATLLLGGMLYWIYPDLNYAQVIISLLYVVIIIVGESLAISANKDRMELCGVIPGKKFSSRRPAQIKFGVSMLILGSCWLVQDRSTAATVFFWGLLVIMLLTLWSALDYINDRRELQLGRIGS